MSIASERVGYALGKGDEKFAEALAKKRNEARRVLIETFRNNVQSAFEQGLENGLSRDVR